MNNNKKKAELKRMSVVPEYHKRSIGTKLT